MITVTGAMNRNTATFGIPVKSSPTGLPTAPAIGTGSARGAGPGVTICPGALLRSTMAAGTISQAAGAGARARSLVLRSTDLLSSVSSEAALVLAAVLVPGAGSDGARRD